MERNRKSIELDCDLEQYRYGLPSGLIAQQPAARREDSRLLLLNRQSGALVDRRFSELPELFKPGDLLVVNDTRVFPARILTRKETGGNLELFLLEYPESVPAPAVATEEGLDGRSGLSARCEGLALIKSAKRPRPGVWMRLGSRLDAQVLEYLADGKARVAMRYQGQLDEVLVECGQVPLPPYIRRAPGQNPAPDRARYQTIYARQTGAVAAPTAGLHFSGELLDRLRACGVKIDAITLHVGHGTFAPVRVRDIREHRLHQEYVEVSDETARLVNETTRAGGRLWAVGTTTVRTLEYAADADGRLHPTAGWCGLYIYPGYRFKLAFNLITNFHLPGSSLLFLVAALTGREKLLASYRHAIDHQYRFYSYGDAMAIIDEFA